MVAKKAKIVIVGAGMSGLVAANKLYTSKAANELFELCVVEGGNRIGGRIHTVEFGDDRIEMGATWIHGIGGSPVHKIAKQIGALDSDQPWEDMDGSSEELETILEGGFQLEPFIVDQISNLYRKMVEFARGKLAQGCESSGVDYYKIASMALKICSSSSSISSSSSSSSSNNCGNKLRSFSLGSFLREALNAYWALVRDQEGSNGCSNSTQKLLEEAIFAIHENAERAHTSAGDLLNLDFHAEREYVQFPDEEITISKGYSSIIESIAAVLPADLIQLGRKVTKIEWQSETVRSKEAEFESPVKLHFSDGSTMVADHVIVTVSLGVLKAGIQNEPGMFYPPLPSFKIDAISRLGFGVVNKLFMQMDPAHVQENRFPFLQMAFHPHDSELRQQNIPWWMRRTASLCPIYKNSYVLLSWFAGKQAFELESLSDEEVINGVSTTINSFLPRKLANSHKWSNGHVNSVEKSCEFKFKNVMKSQWGTDPLFLGSYSYVAVGSSGDDLDKMAEPLPPPLSISPIINSNCGTVAPLQILFAGEATHRTQYSTTHGAYFSGLREANRLLQHYHCDGFSDLSLY